MPRPKPQIFVDQMFDQAVWADDARCRDEEDVRIFDTRMLNQQTLVTGDTRAAMDTCADCPVMMLCLEHAIRYDIREGVWGGMVYEQRLAWAFEHRPDLLPRRFFEEEIAVAA